MQCVLISWYFLAVSLTVELEYTTIFSLGMRCVMCLLTEIHAATLFGDSQPNSHHVSSTQMPKFLVLSYLKKYSVVTIVVVFWAFENNNRL